MVMASADIGNMLQGINLQKDLISQKTPEERQAEFLMTQGDTLNNGSLGGAIAGGIIKGLGVRKMSKADEEKAKRIAAMEEQAKQALEYQKWVQEVERKFKMDELSKIETANNQEAIDKALRLTVDYGDTQALAEIVKANPGIQGVMDDTLPDGVRFEGVNFDQQNGTLVPFGRDADGNVLYGQGMKWEKVASESFLKQRTDSLYEERKREAELAKTEAETAKLIRTAEQPPTRGYQYGDNGQLVPIPGGPADTARQKNLNDEVQQYSQYLDKSGLVELNTALDRANNTIASYKGGDLPGVGPVEGTMVPDIMAGDKGRELRQQLLSVGNLLIKARTGAAMSNAEAARIGREIGVDISGDKPRLIGTTEDSIRRGLSMGKQTLDARMSSIQAGYSPDALQLYQQRTGGVSQAGGAGGDPASIKAAFKAGQIDRATAEAQLKALGFE